MDTDEVFNMSRRITSTRPLGTPDEIASVAWFLLSQEASFIMELLLLLTADTHV